MTDVIIGVTDAAIDVTVANPVIDVAVVTPNIDVATSGPPGPPGAGVPTGGTAGQVLTKVDATSFNTQWTTTPKITVASSAPGSPAVNDVWIDTTT